MKGKQKGDSGHVEALQAFLLITLAKDQRMKRFYEMLQELASEQEMDGAFVSILLLIATITVGRISESIDTEEAKKLDELIQTLIDTGEEAIPLMVSGPLSHMMKSYNTTSDDSDERDDVNNAPQSAHDASDAIIRQFMAKQEQKSSDQNAPTQQNGNKGKTMFDDLRGTIDKFLDDTLTNLGNSMPDDDPDPTQPEN